jgi:hypothetical protein
VFQEFLRLHLLLCGQEVPGSAFIPDRNGAGDAIKHLHIETPSVIWVGIEIWRNSNLKKIIHQTKKNPPKIAFHDRRMTSLENKEYCLAYKNRS